MTTPRKTDLADDSSEIDEETLDTLDRMQLEIQPETEVLPSVSVLHGRKPSQSEPLSPGRSKKRTSDEIYQRSQLPIYTLPSTTPLRSPPRYMTDSWASVGAEPRSNPFHARDGSSNLRNVTMADNSSPSSTAPTQLPSKTQNAPPAPVTFNGEVKSYQTKLDQEFEEFKTDLEQRDRSKDLEQLDWDDLERRYTDEISPLISEENEVRARMSQRMQQCMLWMQISSEKENERAFKRLRTRSVFVQNSEHSLTGKQEHYGKVLQAFETAMSLLRA